jgi:hypothetical protein
MLRIYSHPRSGTHFLEAFLGENFYKHRHLHTESVIWGHWSNMQYRESGNPYGKLYGGHRFATLKHHNTKRPIIYIYRDGRAVAYSVWKTPNFIHKKYAGISFSDFLRLKLDWRGSPRFQPESKHPVYNIAEHWYWHVDSWLKIRKKNFLVVRYEELKNDPDKIYDQIRKKFFPLKAIWHQTPFAKAVDIDPVAQPTGLLPNKASSDAWKTAFSEDDEAFFLKQLPSKQYLYFK